MLVEWLTRPDRGEDLVEVDFFRIRNEVNVLMMQVIIPIAMVGVLLLVFLLSGVFSEHNGVCFKAKWPAIDDDEFVRRCPPGTSREVALKVRRIVSEQLGVPYDHVYPEQNFVDDLDC